MHKILGKNLCNFFCIFLLTKYAEYDIIEDSGRSAGKRPDIIPHFPVFVKYKIKKNMHKMLSTFLCIFKRGMS